MVDCSVHFWAPLCKEQVAIREYLSQIAFLLSRKHDFGTVARFKIVKHRLLGFQTFLRAEFLFLIDESTGIFSQAQGAHGESWQELRRLTGGRCLGVAVWSRIREQTLLN